MAKYFEATFLGNYRGTQYINRTNWVSSNDEVLSATALGLAVALGYDDGGVSGPTADTVLDALLDASNAGLELQIVLVRNLFNVGDFFEGVCAPGVGWEGKLPVGAGDGLLNFAAARCRTNRIRTDIRRGSIALVGGTEEHVEGADTWNATYLGLLTTFCTRMNSSPSVTLSGQTTEFISSVFQKERYVVPGSDPVRHAYRYYAMPEFLDHIAQGVTWSPVERVSSQISRKFGRGA